MSDNRARTDISARLAYWGERAFNSGPVQRTRARRGMTGLRLPGGQAGQGGGVGSGGGKVGDAAARANQVRRQLGAIVKRTPQVMVRISGGGRSVGHVKAHLDYISRNGQIPLEDQHGDKLAGRPDLEALRDEWQFGGFPMSEDRDTNRRQAYNIVLSMPAGTDEAALMRAARDFAQAEFAQFQYAMALHTFDTDPDPSPSPNPHVHLCIKANSLNGTRLNPRKADLQRWREGFAHALREHGVEADATSRLQRLQRERGEKQSTRQIRGRGESLHSVGKFPASAERVARAKQLEAQQVHALHQLARTLAQSDIHSDRQLASAMVRGIGPRDIPEEGGRSPDRGDNRR